MRKITQYPKELEYLFPLARKAQTPLQLMRAMRKLPRTPAVAMRWIRKKYSYPSNGIERVYRDFIYDVKRDRYDRQTAYIELKEYLKAGEKVESIIFGLFGDAEEFQPDKRFPVPQELQQIPMSLSQARPFMENWAFAGDMGGVECHAAYIWTNRRIIWVSKYDGATWLSSAPRNPGACLPKLSGGG